jgi:hypothetical protein
VATWQDSRTSEGERARADGTLVALGCQGRAGSGSRGGGLGRALRRRYAVFLVVGIPVGALEVLAVVVHKAEQNRAQAESFVALLWGRGSCRKV